MGYQDETATRRRAAEWTTTDRILSVVGFRRGGARSGLAGSRRRITGIGAWMSLLVIAAATSLATVSPDAAAFATNACLVDRGGTGCTANDGSIASIVLNTNNVTPGVNPATCTAGSTITVDLLITLGTINATTRSDIGLYLAQDGKAMDVASPTGATACSVLTTPVPAGTAPVDGPGPVVPAGYTGTWSNLDGNACGDLKKAFGQGTVGNPSWMLPTGPITVKCVAGAGNKLSIPAGASYRQNAGTCVTPAADLDPGTSSKCVATTALINIDVVAAADLSITKTDGVTNIDAGSSTTYTIVVSNAGPSAADGATVTDQSQRGSPKPAPRPAARPRAARCVRRRAQ